MQNLKFNQLLILSNSEKSGSAFQFQNHLNLITAANNNVGKSTIVKLLFWTLGCESTFDTVWENLDCRTIVRFSIGQKRYSVLRYKSSISFKEDNYPATHYAKISGDYAKKFADIVDFKALLPNRDDISLEVPPPAYYFLPYYIDQKKSWAKPWDSFDGLQQYAEWRVPIVKYHTGLLPSKHFEIESDKYEKKGSKKILVEDVKKLDIALVVVENHTPKLSEAVTTNEIRFSSMTEEIRTDLYNLAKEQEEILDELAKHESEKADLEHQQTIAEAVIKDLELDYRFSVENLEKDEIECPLCGTFHNNTAVERASVLVDKQQAENQLVVINESLTTISAKLFRTAVKLESVRNKINELNSKYVVEDDKEEKVGLTTIIESIAGKSIQEKVVEDKKEKLLEVDNVEAAIKSLDKEQKDLQSKEVKDDILAFFQDTFSHYAKLLNTDDVNLSAINSPLDYNKVTKQGGAAENIRVVLAYNMAIYSVVARYTSSVISAFVLDTPNQHEQSDTNYDSIVKLILESFPKDAQIIMCAMDNPHLTPYIKDANVIRLDGNRLLDKNLYDEVKTEFDKFI